MPGPYRAILYKEVYYMNTFALKGTFLDTPAPDTLRVREGYLLCENGLCAGFSETAPAGVEVLDYTGKIITPGLVDLHLHAPQYSYCGTAMDLELLDWLQQYTYPEEAHYADPAYAKLGYSYFVRDLKNSATTRACIFATLHTDATLELMHQLRGAGLSAFVGKLGMDRNSPDSYREPSAAAGLAETRRWLDTCRAENTLHAGPVRPMITPRFTPSTSDEYMRGLGELAREYNVPAQSHLSENPGEIAWVAELCPGTKFYGESYSRYGLFGGGVPTVMAHCIYSPDDEAALMKQNRVMIAHCPTSNENVIAGIAPAAHYLRGGWRVGLGSDVAGKDVFVSDDIISSGESMLDIAYELKMRGARNIFTCCTFPLFTAGLEKFDKAYNDGIIKAVLGTNLTYRKPELLEREWYYDVDVSKYTAYFIAAINHDKSVSSIIDPMTKIRTLLDKHGIPMGGEQ